MTQYFALMDKILPDPGGSNARATGEESKSNKVPGWVQAIHDDAAERNNE